MKKLKSWKSEKGFADEPLNVSLHRVSILTQAIRARDEIADGVVEIVAMTKAFR